MSKILLKGCLNHYNSDELYDRFAIDDFELKNCKSCNKMVNDNGMITCKYILDGVETEED